MPRSQVLIFTGAGFSAAAPLRLPTMAGFMGHLAGGELAPAQAGLLQLLRGPFGVSDLEALLRSLLETARSASALAGSLPDGTLVRTQHGAISFQELPGACEELAERVVARVFDVYRLELGPEQTEEIARRLFCPIVELLYDSQPNNNIAIFTTNYDLAVEHFHRSRCGGRFFPSPLVDGFELADDRSSRVFTGDFKEGQLRRTLRLFKLHGSLNWRRSLARGTIESTGFIQEKPAGTGALSESVAIFPAGPKNLEIAEPYRTLQNELRAHLHRSSSCVFIGYSFGDPFISSAVIEAIVSWKVRIIAISPNATRNVRDRLLAPAFGRAGADELLRGEGVVCIDAPFPGDLVVRQVARALRA